jgi:hypothetical protein
MIPLSIVSEPKYVGTKQFCELQILYVIGCIIGSGNVVLINFKIFPESLFLRNTNQCSHLSNISFR